MSYRDEFRAAQREAYWTFPRVFGGIVVVGLAFVAIGFIFKPFAVINRVTDPDAMIAKYEWFHDANGRVKARASQIKAHKSIMANTTDSSELGRLRIELAAQQQSCRELVAQYNANATKTTHEIFMGREAPSSLNPNVCE